MIGILHGYLLDGSGSNLWTRSIVRAMCADGATVHLVCQEPHPERFDFITSAFTYAEDGTVERLFERGSPLPGRCVMHQPILGGTLPVYVWDEYEEFDEVVPMTELTNSAMEGYLYRNVQAVARIVEENGITALHVNHVVLMSVVAQRVSAWTGVPYVVMPHGSALEYAVRPDERLQRLAVGAVGNASRVIAISEEVAERARDLLHDLPPLHPDRILLLDLGVDTAGFQPVAREERGASVAHVAELLREVSRGRTALQAHELRRKLDAGVAPAAACRAVGPFVAKQPDDDVEDRLLSLDWRNIEVAVFVGRLIAAKGIHALLAALPDILRARRRARLLVVGHGPLRNAMEAFVHALGRGDREAAVAALTHAAEVDGGDPVHISAVEHYWRDLDARGRLDEYWESARSAIGGNTVVFTGYLTHREMSRLLPCCDVGVFPSMVLESGPLVFLEAIASGVFPVGTYFGGMKVKIDSIAPHVGPGDAGAMRIRPDPEHVVQDLAAAVPRALSAAPKHAAALRRVAEEQYDWKPVARRLRTLLEEVAAGV